MRNLIEDSPLLAALTGIAAYPIIPLLLVISATRNAVQPNAPRWPPRALRLKKPRSKVRKNAPVSIVFASYQRWRRGPAGAHITPTRIPCSVLLCQAQQLNKGDLP